MGLVGLVEMVNVAPVRRGRHPGRPLLQITANRRIFSGPVRTQGEEVVPLLLHADAKLDRRHRPVLADDIGRLFQVGRRVKRKLGRITPAVEGFSG